MSNFVYSALILMMGFLGCSAAFTSDEQKPVYNFARPDAVHILPDTLREISGLTYLDSTTFACIQDENGILFIYDVSSNSIKQQYAFDMDGDYEGIARVANTIYILRSDGLLLEIENYKSANSKVKSYETGIPADNNEGLCYDADNNRLLIACKGKIGKGSALKNKRVIYGFDLKNKKLSKQAVYDFDLDKIKDFASHHGINTAVKSKRNGKVTEPFIKFATSEICIHPFSKQLYLLSAADHMLFIFSTDGHLLHMEALDPVKFNKAEGLTFFENGDMLITNEAQDKKPSLYRFNYQH